jgi:hypothetical protein
MGRFVASLLVAGVALATPAITLALPELAITPAVLEMKAAPGQAIVTDVTVSNPGTVGYRVSVYAWDMWHDGRNRRYAPPGTFPQSLAQRLSATPTTFALAPGQRQQVQITLDIPRDAKGGQYAVVFFEMSGGDPASGTQGPVLAIAGRIGASVIVDTRAGSATIRAGRIDHVAVEPPTESAPLRVTTGITNDNDTHLRPYGSAVIMRDRKPVGRFTLPSALLLPGQRGVLEGSWSGSLKPGDYTLLLTIVSSDEQGETLERPFRVP